MRISKETYCQKKNKRARQTVLFASLSFAALSLCACNNQSETPFSLNIDNTVWVIEPTASAAKDLKNGFVADAPVSRSTMNGFSCKNASIYFSLTQVESMRKDLSAEIYQAEYQPIVRVKKDSEGYSREVRGDKAIARFESDPSTPWQACLYGKDQSVLVETSLDKPFSSLLWNDPSIVVSSLQEGKGTYEDGGFAWKIGYHADSMIVLDCSKSQSENGYDVVYESLWFFFRDEQSQWRIGRTHEGVTYSKDSRCLAEYRQTEYAYRAISPTSQDKADLNEEDFCGYAFDGAHLYLAPLTSCDTILTEGLKNLGIPHPFEEPLIFSPRFNESVYDSEDQKIDIDAQTIGLTLEGKSVSVWDFLAHF